MRAGVLRIFIVAMLFVSVEGAAGAVEDAHFHQTHHAHTDDADDQWFPELDESDHDGDSCEHFCHAHVVALTTHFSLPGMPMFRYNVPAHCANSAGLSAAPPTPPPNI